MQRRYKQLLHMEYLHQQLFISNQSDYDNLERIAIERLGRFRGIGHESIQFKRLARGSFILGAVGGQ